MSEWKIDNGTILIGLYSKEIYRPNAEAIYTQKDLDSFEHNGCLYPPLSSLDLNYSKITAHPFVRFSLEDKRIVFNLIVTVRGVDYPLSMYDGIFNEYLILDNKWRCTDDSVNDVNHILLKTGISNNQITFKQYAVLTRELSNTAIRIEDNVLAELKGSHSSDNDIPSGLNAKLYPYQDSGYRWLSFMVDNGCGCLLGDEMGLGKTLQIIALFAHVKETKQNTLFLVVCPVSLLENWKREIEKFCPSLNVLLHYGARRTGDSRNFANYDVVITSYSGAVSDFALFSLVKWDIVVIDEAQNIKNPSARRTKAICSITKEIAIAVTGTPFENHMSDIWSLMNFAMPGFLGSLSAFDNQFVDDIESAQKLEAIISPLLLRRRVKEVAKDLPARVDIPQSITMREEEALLYDGCRMKENNFDALKELKIDTIQKLRVFCTHPRLYNEAETEADLTKNSNKYQRLCEILEEIVYNKEKVVIFTSFRKMRELMCDDLSRRFGVYVNFIDGSVEAKARQAIIDDFSKVDGSGVLVLNPRAAGAGLNITCANHVVHYNLEWNPAIEDQASARVYRRGQDKTVFIHRLFYAKTIEEVIDERIRKKRNLSETAIIGTDGSDTNRDDLIKALTYSPLQHYNEI